MKIFITGAAGYIGQLLIHHFSIRGDVEVIIALDKQCAPQVFRQRDKVHWIQANTADTNWQNLVMDKEPDVVIHAAWQIREMFFYKHVQRKWNVDGSDNVFRFSYSCPFVKILIFISSVAVYGAVDDFSIVRPFKEHDSLQENEYVYGVQKKIAEEKLKHIVGQGKRDTSDFRVIIFRPASVIGPEFFRSVTKKISLQSFFKIYLPFVIASNRKWCRQFVHEQDFCRAVETVLGKPVSRSGFGIEIYNLAAPGVVTGAHMAAILNKKIVYIPVILCRVLFFVFWHLSFGRIPTSRGAWRFLYFPLVADASRFTHDYDFFYYFSSFETYRSLLE